MTEWRAIPGYEGRYEVSDDGQVRSLPRSEVGHRNGKPYVRHRNGRLMRPATDRDGYQRLCLLKDGVREYMAVHVAVLLAFVGPRPAGQLGRHLDDDPSNNRIGNLAWGTVIDNAADALANDRYRRGSRHCGAKLTEADVIAIRAAKGRIQRAVLAQQYDVAPNHINLLQSGKAWKHVGTSAEIRG